MQITGLEASSTMPQREEALGFFPLGHLRCCRPSRGPLHPPPPRGRLTASFNCTDGFLQSVLTVPSRCSQDEAQGGSAPGLSDTGTCDVKTHSCRPGRAGAMEGHTGLPATATGWLAPPPRDSDYHHAHPRQATNGTWMSELHTLRR